MDDNDKLTTWVRSRSVVAIQIYRDGFLHFDSNYADEDFYHPQERFQQPWKQTYSVTFADGTAQVVLYGFYAFQFYNWAQIVSLLLSFLIFLVIIMVGIRRTIRYIHTLSKEIKILEGGGLDYPITIRGRDELSELAEGLDAMRQSFRAQTEQEKRLAAASQRMVTEMSHDLRTPLTSIMLYTEILLSGKYQDEGQEGECIQKIDQKARQMKQLSDHLFEYALVASGDDIQLEETDFRSIFYDTLSEVAAYLEQQGFLVELDFAWDERIVRVNHDYITRIFDNLTSNIVKYADPVAPIQIRSLCSDQALGFAFKNRKAELTHPPESTKIGLHNIKSMMEKMDSKCLIEQDEKSFEISLLFHSTKKRM